jgi:flagellar biosynthetic protein FliR
VGEIVSFFNFNVEEMLSFFAVLVRFSILFAVLPFVGDRVVPAPVKVLLALAVSIALFPALVATGRVKPVEAAFWGSSASGIIGTVALEVMVGLLLGFVAKLIFDGISFGANLVGNFMGFASASVFDPHQESQTEVIAQIQTTVAMLIFLALDGHHLMLRASLDSYRIVGLGRASFGASVGQRLIQMTGETLRFGIQIAAPVAVAIFSVNITFGVLSKAMPQLNIFMLSFAITSIVGFVVMFLSVPEFQGEVGILYGKMWDWLQEMLRALASGR